jgi:uncharacterized protein (TIGR02453 family)
MATVATSGVEQFTGFSDEAFQFLLELQAEQNRAWFKAHQADFLRLCRKPLELFVTELQARLVDVFPGFVDAEPHYFRIQRDTRFSKDKAPYKTNLAADVSLRPSFEAEDRHVVPGVYVSFGLDGEYVAVGAWHMSPEVLLRYRSALDSAVGARIQAQVDGLLARGFGLEAMEKLKRVPPPFPQDHPRAELLKHKGLAVVAQAADGVSGSPKLLDWAEKQLRQAAPLIDLLDNALAEPHSR